MKLWSKEALVLGGIYGVLDTPFSLLGLNLITDILSLLFIFYTIMLCFNRTPKFIAFAINQHPQISYYLSAIGWIPYVIIVLFLGIVGSRLLFGYTDTVLEFLLFSLTVFEFLAAIVSPIIAYAKSKRKK